MGGGGGGDTTSTVYQSNLPQYAEPYYKSLMERALNESKRPYDTYQGQRITGMSGDTKAGLGMATNFANSTPQQLKDAITRSYGVGDKAMGMANYKSNAITEGFNPSQINSTYNPTQFTNTYQGTNFTNNYQAGQFGAKEASQYMSPYMQAVTDVAKKRAGQDAQIEQMQRNADAAKAGAFGGSRAAVQAQLARNAGLDRMAELQAEGQQSAFENAQQQFERDRAARQFGATYGLDVQKAQDASRQFGANLNLDTQKARDAAAQFKQSSLLDAFKASEDSRQFGANINLDAQKANEQFRQSGQRLGMDALSLAQDNNTQLAEFQKLRDQMTLDRIKARLGVGQTREDYQQEGLDIAYQDFINQRDSGRQNLQFLSSLLQGVPISANQDIKQTTPTNPLAGAAGTLTGLQALYQLSR